VLGALFFALRDSGSDIDLLENYDIKSLLIKKMILEYLQVQRLYSIGSGKEAYLS